MEQTAELASLMPALGSQRLWLCPTPRALGWVPWAGPSESRPHTSERARTPSLHPLGCHPLCGCRGSQLCRGAPSSREASQMWPAHGAKWDVAWGWARPAPGGTSASFLGMQACQHRQPA